MAKKKTSKKTKKKTTRRKVRKKATGRRGRRSKLASTPLHQLQEEIERRKSDLLDRRADLKHQLDEIDQELAAFDGSPRRGPGRPPASARPRRSQGRRPRNKVNLVDALQTVLRSKTMGVTEVAAAVKKAGYKTRSENFRTIVNQALLQNPATFKKVARGQYTAK